MRTYRLPILIICICVFFCQQTNAQQSVHSPDGLINLPTAYLSKVRHKMRQTWMTALPKKRKNTCNGYSTGKRRSGASWTELVPAGAQQLFTNSEKQYAQLAAKMRSAGELKLPGTNERIFPNTTTR